MSTSVAGKSVTLDSRYLHVELEDGRIISTPVTWYPELQNASLKQLADYRFICGKTGVEWKALDFQLSIESMLATAERRIAA